MPKTGDTGRVPSDDAVVMYVIAIACCAMIAAATRAPGPSNLVLPYATWMYRGLEQWIAGNAACRPAGALTLLLCTALAVVVRVFQLALCIGAFALDVLRLGGLLFVSAP